MEVVNISEDNDVDVGAKLRTRSCNVVKLMLGMKARLK